MKKLFAFLALMFVCQMAFCQTYTEIINKFKYKPGADYREILKSELSEMMEYAAPQTKAIYNNVDCQKILIFEDCDEDVCKEFIAYVKNIEKKYKKFGEEGDLALFYKGSKDSPQAVIVVSYTLNDCGLMVLEGKLAASQLDIISKELLTKEEDVYGGQHEVVSLDPNFFEGLEGGDDIAVDFEMVTSAPPPPPLREEPRPEPTTEQKIYVMAEVGEQPEFPGGDAAMYQWLGENVVYPPKAQENGISGTVVVSFTISKDGSVTNIKIARGKDPALDKEAVRVVSIMPKWKPGVLNGEPVPVSYTLPLKFQLTGPEKEESGGQ